MTFAPRQPSLARAEVLRAIMLAGLAAALLVALGPPGGDTAAHLYRTLLVREGVHVWDNLWFSGQYPLASYSLLYYLPAALVGNTPLVVAAVVLSAALFASLAVREWGEAAPWPARVFALLSAGPLFTGTYSYALGLAATLAALRLLQAGRSWLAIVAATLALGFSPLAFAFLLLILLAVVLARRRLGARALAIGIGLAAVACLQGAALLLFPTEGVYTFSPLSLAAVLTVSALGAAVALRSQRGAVLAVFFGLWAAISLIAFLIPSPFGDNLTRLRALVFPLVLLTVLLARFRPRPLAFAALAFALAYNVAPYVRDGVARAATTAAAEESFWQPALAFLRERESADYRVEVVPTFDHWEAYWVPRAGFALARGWYRQIDLAQNPELYRKPLVPAVYRAWLRRMSVRFVLVPLTRLGPLGADREAALLRSGRAGLQPVFRSRHWIIFEFTDPVPILTGATPALIDRLGHKRITGWMSAPGTYRLRIRYTPLWRVRRGRICVEPATDGMTRLVARRGGPFTLVLPEAPATVVRSAISRRDGTCGR